MLDGLLGPAAHAALREAFLREPQWEAGGEIFASLASAQPPQQELLRAFADDLAGKPVREAVAAICGRRLVHADARAFVYLPGHYLLPHTDWRARERRAVAWVYYVDAQALRGGALRLHACTRRGGLLTATRAAKQLAPRPDRLVLFEVSPVSLHEVREVRAGARRSLTGWFYA